VISAIKASCNYKWWVFGTIGIGTFLSVVDHGSVMVALPSIEHHFGSDLPTVQWIVVGYALVISVLILPMGRLGDIIGRKQVYVGGMIIFVVSAGLAGASPNLGSLIAAKIFQGDQRAGRVISIRHAPGEISPRPAAGRGVGVGMQLTILLCQKPIPDFCAFIFREKFTDRITQRVDRQRGDPCCQIRVNRPAAIGAHRLVQEFHTLRHHRMVRHTAAGQAHGYKTRQWRGLKKAAIGRLNLLQD